MTGWVGTLLCPPEITGASFDVSDFVADPANARAGLQAAFDAVAVSGGILNFSAGVVYTISDILTLTSKSGFKWVGNGATIKAANTMPSSNGHGMIRLQACTGFHVKDLIIDGNRANRATQVVYSHNVILTGCHDFAFENVISKNAPAQDCWYLEPIDKAQPATFNTNGLFFNCTGDNGFRQGMSIINADNIQIIGGQYSNTNGSEPQAGIDLEPNVGSANPGIKNVLIRGVTFTANQGAGVAGAIGGADVTQVTIEGCRFNGGAAAVATQTLGMGVEIRGTDWLVQRNTFENFNYSTKRAVVNIQASIVGPTVVDANSFNTINMQNSVIHVNSISNPGPHTISNNVGFALSDTFVVNGNPSVTTVTNNTTSGVRTDPTPTPPQAVNLDHCAQPGGGGGGATRQSQYVEQLTAQTAVLADGQKNVLRLTHTPDDSTSWWYIATGVIGNSDSATAAQVRLRQATAAVDLGNVTLVPQDLNDNPEISFVARHTYGVSPGSQNIDVDLSASGANTASLDDIRIVGLEATGDDKFVSSDAETSSSSDVYATKATVTDTFTGDYLFVFSAEIHATATTAAIQVRGDLDGTKYGSIVTGMRNDVTAWRTWITGKVVTGMTGLHTALIEFARETGGTAPVTIRKAHINIIKLDGFANHYYAENRARTTTVLTTPQDKTILTQTPVAGDHLVLGGFIIDGVVAADRHNADFERDGVSYSAADEEPRTANDSVPFFVALRENETAVSRTWKTQFWSTAGTQTTGASESWIAVLELTQAPTPVTINSLGLGLTVLGGTGIVSIPGIKGRHGGQHIGSGIGAGIDLSSQN